MQIILLGMNATDQKIKTKSTEEESRPNQMKWNHPTKDIRQLNLWKIIFIQVSTFKNFITQNHQTW